MTKSDPKPTIDSDKDTVIGLKGSAQHHDLKSKAGEAGDPDHTDKPTSQEVVEQIKDAPENQTATAVSDALKKAAE